MTQHAHDTRSGRPSAAMAYVRPDAKHTSYPVGLVWMDPRAYRLTPHPGSEVPGGNPLTGANQITGAEKDAVWASFNSGFQMKDANGGYWQDGRTVQPLVAGAASLVLGRDGSLAVRSWDGAAPNAGVQAVR